MICRIHQYQENNHQLQLNYSVIIQSSVCEEDKGLSSYQVFTTQCGSQYYHDIYRNKQIQNGSINSIFNSDYFVFCLFFGKLITFKIRVEGGRERVCKLNKKENKMCLERQIIVNHSVHSENQMNSQQKMQKAETSSLSSRVIHTSSVFHFVMSQLSWILRHFYFMHQMIYKIIKQRTKTNDQFQPWIVWCWIQTEGTFVCMKTDEAFVSGGDFLKQH